MTRKHTTVVRALLKKVPADDSYSFKDSRFRYILGCFKMHHAYQPILPCGSKYLQQKWDKATYEEHKQKILRAKPVVDTSAPPTYGHLHLKLRKLKLDKDRLSTIERDNHLLLKKISYIMKTEGRVDNKNEYITKSLNREKQERELFRINQENGAILERIAKCKSRYSVQKWSEDWRKTKNYMSSITRYPQSLCELQIQKLEGNKFEVAMISLLYINPKSQNISKAHIPESRELLQESRDNGQHKKMYKRRLKNNKLKVERLTDKQEQGVELIHQDKELNEDYQGENPIEKA